MNADHIAAVIASMAVNPEMEERIRADYEVIVGRAKRTSRAAELTQYVVTACFVLLFLLTGTLLLTWWGIV